MSDLDVRHPRTRPSEEHGEAVLGASRLSISSAASSHSFVSAHSSAGDRAEPADKGSMNDGGGGDTGDRPDMARSSGSVAGSGTAPPRTGTGTGTGDQTSVAVHSSDDQHHGDGDEEEEDDDDSDDDGDDEDKDEDDEKRDHSRKPPSSSLAAIHSLHPDPDVPAPTAALLTLPPPPSYSLHVRDLSIGVPPQKHYIPTPIPIPIPDPVWNIATGRWRKHGETRQARPAGMVEESEKAVHASGPDRLSSPQRSTPRAQGNTIIRHVNADVMAGEMLAIIGGSGSGKTTLLHAVAARLNDLPVTGGSIGIVPASTASPPADPSSPLAPNAGELIITSPSTHAHQKPRGLSSLLSFVRQSDYLLPHLTVYETLAAAAALRLPASVPPDVREKIVEQTISELGLAAARDRMVGGDGGVAGGMGRKGISGGERRRVSIGCCLVTLPSLVVLDEPTTGLDSFTAYQLLETLSDLAKRGRTIILSLHQPRSDAFHLFSRLLLLSRGDVVYSGPVRDCLPYFASLGHVPPERTNPLDFLIDVSSVDTRDEEREQEDRRRVSNLVSRWAEHESMRRKEAVRGPLAEDAVPPVPRDSPPPQAANVTARSASRLDVSALPPTALARTLSDSPFPVGVGVSAKRARSKSLLPSFKRPQKTVGAPEKRPNVVVQTAILLPRAWKNVYRNALELVGHAFQAIVLGVLVGITFFRLGESPADIQSLKTIAYQHAPCFFYLSQVVWIYKWCTTLVIFDREREDHLYSAPAWVLSEFIANLPANVLAPSLYAVLIYFICGLWTEDVAAKLFLMIGECILFQLDVVGFALMMASVERSFARASLLCNAIAIFFLLTAGYVLESVPVWISWFRWLSPYFYSYRIVAHTQFHGRMFACEGVTGPALSQCNGDNVLRGLRMDPTEALYPSFMGLFGFFVVTHFAAILSLSFWKPGGVRHAAQSASTSKGKESTESEIDIKRNKVDVEAVNARLEWVPRLSGVPGRSRNVIFKDINARFPSGQVSVIMGPSGSGKSSFLRLCSSRPLRGGAFGSFRMTGDITFNGVPASHKTRQLCAFVEQEDDYHLPALTVRETLRFAATLSLPSNVSRKRKHARAEEVLRMLGLKDCADNLVGGELLKGISGGEKRRLSLACQMVHDPAVLIVDEPTSGLDAHMAHNVMKCLNDIARSGRTVIVSLHQPRSDIFHLGDNYLILAKSGNVVFNGMRDELLPHLEFAGHVCPPLFNPADFVMDLVSVDVRTAGRQDATNARVERLVESWKRAEAKRRLIQKRLTNASEDASDEKGQAEEQRLGVDNVDRITPMRVALPVIFERSVRNVWRQQDLWWTRIIQIPVLGICFFIFYLRLNRGPAGAQDRIGLIQENTSALPFAGFLNLLAIYPMERNIFFHDWQSSGGAYSPATFLISFTAFALPFEIFASLLYTCIMLVAVGQQVSVRIFFEFAVTILTLVEMGESLGIMFASVVSTMGLSVSLISTALTVGSQMSGIISLSLPTWLADIAWAIPVKAAARVQSINEFTGLTFNCPPETIANGACVAATGEQVLELFGFHDRNTAKFLGIGVAISVAYKLLAWIFLSARMRFI